jgi:hypothetical protein
VPTKGMWIKVFVKALPYIADRLADKFLFGGSAEDNICISDAQYYELNALRNLWCEILEF